MRNFSRGVNRLLGQLRGIESLVMENLYTLAYLSMLKCETTSSAGHSVVIVSFTVWLSQYFLRIRDR